MHSHKMLLAVAPLVAVAAADFELDPDDVPRQCRDICRPIVELGQRCETDDIRGATDREEDQLERQCVCTNDSFAVGDVTGLCAACMYDAYGRSPNGNSNNNNNGDVYDDDDDDNDSDDGLDDVDRIMRVCGFSSTSYSEQATSVLSGITVSASPATAVSQLTWSQTGNNVAPTGGSNSGNGNNNNNGNNGNNGNNDNNSNDSGNGNDQTVDRDPGNQDSSNTNNGDDDSAATLVSSQGVLCLAGAFALGAALLLQ